MRSLESWLLTYALNALWQVPIVFAAAWLAARASRRAGPAFQHALWTSALVAEVFVPAFSVRPEQVVQALLHWLASSVPAPRAGGAGHRHDGTGAGSRRLPHPAHAAGRRRGPLSLRAFYFAVRLCIGLHRTASLSRRAEPLALSGYAGQSYHRYAQLFGVPNAKVAASTEIAGPITLGIRRPTLLLPTELDTNLLGEDLDAVFAHEFAHMRRRDFAKNLAYEVLSLPIAFHPLLWLTRRRIAESRELVCDRMAAEAVAGPQRYARSLLRLATHFAASPSQLPSPTPSVSSMPTPSKTSRGES